MNIKNIKTKILGKITAVINPVSAKADVKRSHIIQLTAGLAVLILINILGNYFFVKTDLTEEKRYSLSDSTKQLLKVSKNEKYSVKEVLLVRCYLDGDIPADYKELRNALKDLLDEFRSYNSYVEYEFIDPNNFKETKSRDEFYNKLLTKGLSPILVRSESKGKQEQQYIFPYAEITYGGRSVFKTLLSTKTGFSQSEVIKSSIQNLEYSLYSAIRSLIQGIRPSIAFLYGQGEPNAVYLLDIIQALDEQYIIDSLRIDGKIDALTERYYDSADNTKIKFRNKYECLVVAKPTLPFTQKDLYIIDQYIMNGGKVLWLIDPLTAEMDSLQSKASTMAVSNLTGAEECLFAYGARLNNDLVMDLQCSQVPIVTGQYGNGQPQMTYYPWNFFPVVSPNPNNIIADKINPVKMDFVSTIDIVEGNNKTVSTPLLLSSANTRLLNAPAEVSLQMLKQKQDAKLFNLGSKTLAVLIEGEFSSAFKNRLPQEMLDNPMIANKSYSDSTAMIVVADGDIIKNTLKQNQVVPLGYDVYTQQMYGNKEFLINCVNYLCSDKDLIPLRSREVIVRKLDMAKAERTKLQWQLFNFSAPLFVVLLMGICVNLIRRKQFIKK